MHVYTDHPVIARFFLDGVRSVSPHPGSPVEE
jgi:hypothetical protein